MVPFPSPRVSQRLALTTCAAAALHLLVILGVDFTPGERERRAPPRLDVLRVQVRGPAPPVDASYVAEADREGGRESAGPPPSRPAASAPLPELLPDPPPAPAPDLAAPAVPAVTDGSETRASRTGALSAADLRAQVIESLSAALDERLQAYAERPRRKWITAATREHAYAAYMEAWRRKVERVGNLNYPNEARRRGLSGTLSLDVAVNADGSVAEVFLRRSSGEEVLDEAARRIVELAAPFARFPPAILEEVDVLHIERTWMFSSRNEFNSR